jgi:hypothetical protein
MTKAGHGNDGVWKAWKAMKPAFHASHTPWESFQDFAHSHGFGDDHCDDEDCKSPPETRNQSHSHVNGLVNQVSGLKRKECPALSGTLSMLAVPRRSGPPANQASTFELVARAFARISTAFTGADRGLKSAAEIFGCLI